MNRAIVIVDDSRQPTQQAPIAVGGRPANTHADVKRYECWVPNDYLALQLKQDVVRYWQLKHPSKFELIDEQGHEVQNDVQLELSRYYTRVFTLRRLDLKRSRRSIAVESIYGSRDNDPFRIQEQLFELFLFYALQNTSSRVLGITSYQFKLLVQKTTSCTSLPYKRRKLEFETRVALAFKSAAPNSTGAAGANFDAFLDALVDVACYIFPKADSKEQAFSQLATQCLLPLYEIERQTRSIFSWEQIDGVLEKDKVRSLIERFAKPLDELSAAYSSTVGGDRRQCGLQFHEFAKFMHDVKPPSVPLKSSELCNIFIRCCRAELTQSYSESITLSIIYAQTGVLKRKRESCPARPTSFDSSGSDCITVPEIPCGKMSFLFSALALLVAPRLMKTKDQLNRRALDKICPSTKLAIYSFKAFTQQIAYHLKRDGGDLAKNSAAFAAARTHFLDEFTRLHREENVTDYLGECVQEIRDLTRQHEESSRSFDNISSTPNQQEGSTEDFNPEYDLTELKLAWDEEKEELRDGDDDSSDESSASVRVIDEKTLHELRCRQYEEMLSIMSDADEIYAFLASELRRHTLDQRTEDPEIIPQFLDMWVAAGQKYSHVVNEMSANTKTKAAILSRFGRSLYVFAMQVLRNTTKTYKYAEMFHVTNARVYHVNADLWDHSNAAFRLDLAKETLSLAAGKLASACDEYAKLVSLYNACDQHISITSSDNGDALGDWIEGFGKTDDSNTTVYDKYVECLLHRANCLSAYGDILAHSHAWPIDHNMISALDINEEQAEGSVIGSLNTSITLYAAQTVLAKTSTPAEFYREAWRLYEFALTCGTDQIPFIKTHQELAMTEFKLASILPRGCPAERVLLDKSMSNLAFCKGTNGLNDDVQTSFELQRKYVAAIRVLRHKFFQAEIDQSPTKQKSIRNLHQDEQEVIVPFYRFVLAAVFRDYAKGESGYLSQYQMSILNKDCHLGPVSDFAMKWLLSTFESHESLGLTEKGLLDYFAWIAEADPIAFCQLLDIFTARYTDTHQPSITTSELSQDRSRQQSMSSMSDKRKRLLSPARSRRRLQTGKAGIAECVVVLSGKMMPDANNDFSSTTSPSDVRLEPEVIDLLPSTAEVPEELSKFCFPDDIYLSTDPLPPKAFDIVLTDIKGNRLYGSCFHFYEEKDPGDILALISRVQKGKTGSLPPWISLKDVQQRQTSWKCFVPKCLCILSSYPLFQTFRESLVQLYRLSTSSASLEPFIFNLLEEIPVPESNLSQTLLTLVDRGRLITGYPSHDMPLYYPTEVDFTILFQCLSPDNILKVYGFLLTEKKVVLCSKNYSILTPASETFRALLHPFECQLVYIPVLPLSLLDFVSAPVPFFMGVCSDKRVNQLTSEGVIVVDLDQNDILLPSDEILPSLPEVKGKKLLQALRKVSLWPAGQHTKDRCGGFRSGELSKMVTLEPLELSDAEIGHMIRHDEELCDKWAEVQALFSSFAARLLKDVRKYCQKTDDGSTVFDKTSFMAMNPSTREFCSQLFQTQLFQRFLDKPTSIADQSSSGTELDQWRLSVRAMSNVLRKPDSNDEATKPNRYIIRAPPPTSIYPIGETPGDARKNPDSFPSFNTQAYDELLQEFKKTEPIDRTNLHISNQSSGSSLHSPGDSVGSGLVTAARRRLENPRSEQRIPDESS